MRGRAFGRGPFCCDHPNGQAYGTSRRQFRGKKSQTVQFGPEALAQLRVLLDHENLQRKT